MYLHKHRRVCGLTVDNFFFASERVCVCVPVFAYFFLFVSVFVCMNVSVIVISVTEHGFFIYACLVKLEVLIWSP